ncbi:MAG: hypothetical protein E4G90_00590, partial [Gemmatimonadales bacterium]
MRRDKLLHRLAKGWVLAVLALLSPVCLSGQSHVPDADSDGPHVYWESSSTAIVFYLCEGLFQ